MPVCGIDPAKRSRFHVSTWRFTEKFGFDSRDYRVAPSSKSKEKN
jgi:hypothetical protein